MHTKFAERAFSFSGPAEWNCLPSDIRMTTDTTIFKKKLKAFFYKQALAFFVLKPSFYCNSSLDFAL